MPPTPTPSPAPTPAPTTPADPDRAKRGVLTTQRAGANVRGIDRIPLNALKVTNRQMRGMFAIMEYKRLPHELDSYSPPGNRRTPPGRLPLDYAEDNKALKGTDAYWRLNEARSRE